MQAAAAACGEAAPGALKGVVQLGPDNWAYTFMDNGVERQISGELTARRAADCYDAVMRGQRCRVVNTPLCRSDIQAVAGEDAEVTLQRHLAARAAPPVRYMGVQQTGPKVFSAFAYVGLTRKSLGKHATAEEAARAYDKEMRRQGILAVNFPRLPGQYKATLPVDAGAPMRGGAAVPPLPPPPAQPQAPAPPAPPRGDMAAAADAAKPVLERMRREYADDEQQQMLQPPPPRIASPTAAAVAAPSRAGPGATADAGIAGAAPRALAAHEPSPPRRAIKVFEYDEDDSDFDSYSDSEPSDAAAALLEASDAPRERRPGGFYAAMASPFSRPPRGARCESCRKQKTGTCGTPTASLQCLKRTPDMPRPCEAARAEAARAEAARAEAGIRPLARAVTLRAAPSPPAPPLVPLSAAAPAAAGAAAPVSMKVKLHCGPKSPNTTRRQEEALQARLDGEAAAARFKGVGYNCGAFITLEKGRPTDDTVYPTAQAAADAYDARQRELGCRVVNTPLFAGEIKAVRGEKFTITMRRAKEKQLRADRAAAAAAAAGAATRIQPPPPHAAAAAARREPEPESPPVRAAAKRAAEAPPAEAQPAAKRARSCAADSSPDAAPSTNCAEGTSADAPLPAAEAEAAAAHQQGGPHPQPAPPAAPAAELVAFLRSISPPLQAIDAVAAVAASSGLTMAMLRDALRFPPEQAITNVHFLCSLLGITSGGDKFALQLALRRVP